MPRPSRRLDLLHADRDLVIANKPAGLLTIPSAPGLGDREDTLLGRAREYARHKQGRGAYVGMLHRLDRETSGALAIALSHEAHERGRALFRAHRFERHYLALVRGVPAKASGTVRARISAEYRDGRRAAVDEDEPGRDAVTHYTVKEAFAGCALLELTLETGRQHQIRIHLATLGHAVLGDKVYGPDVRSPIPTPRILLHAWTLAFPHPITGQRISATAALPEDFEKAVKLARRRIEAAPRG